MRIRSVVLLALLAACAAPAVAGMLPPSTVAVPMRDGVELVADLWLPDTGPGPWATILVMTPYGRGRFVDSGLPLPTDDYAWVIVDWRGYGDSPGTPLSSNGLDGYDAVEWIAAQPFSDGKVGMHGSSALGVVQFQTAREHPPHLRACVPQFADMQRDYQQFYLGGVLKWEYALIQAFFGYIDLDLWLDHPSHDWFWDLLESSGDYADELATPMLLVAGWYDLDTRGVLWGWEQLVTRSDPAVRGEHRLLVGPWTHADEDSVEQGELSYPAAAGVADLEALAFLDRWLRGVETVSDPPVRWFELGADRWRWSEAWPPDGLDAVGWRLDADGTVGPALPADPGEVVFTADPADPSPTVGGPRSSLVPVLEGPADLRLEVEARSDAVLFTSDPATAPLTIAGSPVVRLRLVSDRLDTDLMVRMTDVYPDGRSMLLVDGTRRARFRDGYEIEDLLVPGVAAWVEVELEPLAWTLRPGHRLRLVVTSANSPRFHVNPNDGGPLYDDGANPLVVENRILIGPTDGSILELPVLTGLFADGFESGDAEAWSSSAP